LELLLLKKDQLLSIPDPEDAELVDDVHDVELPELLEVEDEVLEPPSEVDPLLFELMLKEEPTEWTKQLALQAEAQVVMREFDEFFVVVHSIDVDIKLIDQSFVQTGFIELTKKGRCVMMSLILSSVKGQSETI